MLLRDDVVGDRQAQAGALSGWFGSEERLEQFIPDLGLNTGTVVPYLILTASPRLRVLTFSIGLKSASPSLRARLVAA